MVISHKTKRTVILICTVICVLVIATALLALSEATKEYGIGLGLIADQQQKEYPDNDKDGIPNWQEVIWNTDPENPDTDGDGTSDGDEVTAGRNPRVAGPNDSTEIYPLISSYDDEIRNSTSTTQRVARRLFTDYAELTSRGIPVTPQVEQALINSSVEELRQALPPFVPYSESELTIINDNSEEAIRTYAQNITDIIYSHQLDAYPNGTRAEKMLASHRDIENALLETPTPQILTKEHLHALNSAAAVHFSLKEIARSITTDPLVITIAIDEYETAISHVALSFYQLDLFFYEQKIFFSEPRMEALFPVSTR